VTELILHHYPSSPFSEKIRALLGYKKLSWRSVIIPAVMPKPDVLALTGGYRKTPLLQIGCDVYCDTRIMARVIDRLAPEPPIYPKAEAASAEWLAQWADQTLFFGALPYAFQGEGLMRMASRLTPDEATRFIEDRAAMGKDARIKPTPGPVAFTHMPVYLAQLDSQLAGRPFVLGAEPCIADFACYHALWFIREATPATLAPYANLSAWFERIVAFGHGQPSELSSAHALEICRRAEPAPRGPSAEQDQNGVRLGARVVVRPSDTGRDPSEGELVHLEADCISIRRQDERAGTAIVHFPRIGYELRPIA
jgi:glutathione S-transferase